MGSDRVEVRLDVAGEKEGAKEAGGAANDGQREAFGHHHTEDLMGLRAEREADADFARAARDRVTHDAIDAYRGKKQSERSEAAGERGEEAFLGERGVNLVFLRAEMEDGQFGVDGGNRLADGGGKLPGIGVGFQIEGESAQLVRLTIGLIKGGSGRAAQAVVAGVGGEADDQDVVAVETFCR